MEASPTADPTRTRRVTTPPVPPSPNLHVPEDIVDNMAMEDREVERLMEQHVVDGFEELEDLITDYDPDSITPVDLTEFTWRLVEIRQKLADVRKNVRIVIRALQGDANEVHRERIKTKVGQAAAAVKQHDSDVKAKIEVLRNAATTTGTTPKPENPKAKRDFAATTLESVKDQLDFLVVKLSEADDVDNMSDNVKREVCAKRLVFQEDMFKIKMAFNKAKADIYKEGLDVKSLEEVEELMGKLSVSLKGVEANCDKTVAILKKLDEKDELYSTSKSTSATPYPTPKFSGASGQNLITWLEKMYQAMQDNQISKNKQVTILRENLQGPAKKLVSENVLDWTDAKKLLMDAHGNPKLLWMDLYVKARSKLTVWRDKFSDRNLSGTEAAMDGIRVMQEFLREADLMSKSNPSIQLNFEISPLHFSLL